MQKYSPGAREAGPSVVGEAGAELCRALSGPALMPPFREAYHDLAAVW
jgi:hypothetical protein